MPTFQNEEFVNHRYQVVRLLGRGAMGEVYLVEDMIKVHRLVALKVLKSDDLEEADFWSRGEYEALTRLRHPNLARVYDFGRVQDSNDFYIISEYILGQDLLSATRGIDFEDFLDVVVQVCRALEYIHTQGYVHFDVKPDNVLVTRERVAGQDEGSKVQWNPELPTGSDTGRGPARVKLIDFGLAERITGTFNFAIKGTFQYVAPEIIRGQTPDKRADLYSLGVTLFQLLTGDLPFLGDDGKAIDRAKINWRERIRGPLQERPAWLVDVLVRLLEDDPDDRFPSARAIIQALNAGSGRHYEVETAETQVSYLYSSRLVGRRKELNRLKEEAEAILENPAVKASSPDNSSTDSGTDRSGDTSVVSQLLRDGSRKVPLFLISGEIGVGKSRLFEEFQHFLKMREIPVHVGNCYETNHDAYLPFREIIEQLALAVGLESEVFQKHRQSVRRLCPMLCSSVDGGEDEGGAGFRPDKERLYFIDGLANFIIDAVVTMPCCINVNNLHWADEASMELLAHLIDRIVEMESQLPTGLPLILMATVRSDEALADFQRSILNSLREEERIREIAVRRFSRTQIAELIHSMLQMEEIPRGFLDRLEERTSGNPLFIVETLKGLQEEGIISRDGDAWKIRGGDLSKVEIPHGLDAILLRRVGMLEVLQQHLLEALAVYDKPTTGKLIERCPEFARVNVITHLRDLENRGMVSKVMDGGRLQFSISQPKLREIIYDNIPEERRQPLHGALATALLEVSEGKAEGIVEDLAYHYQRSNRTGKALEYTLLAGDACRKVFAHDRAIEYYRHVIQQTEGKAETAEIWFETHEKIGDIGLLAGDYEVAQASYDTLLEATFEQRTAARARILRKHGKVDEIRGEYERALRSYKEARDTLEESEDGDGAQAEIIRVYNAIGWIYVCMGKYDKAMKIAVDALRRIDGLDERGEHAMIFSTIGSANYYKGNLEQAVEFHSRALEIRENLENVPEIIISLNNLGDAYVASGEYMEALKNYRQAFAQAEEIGDAFGRAMALHNLSKTHLILGDDESADTFLRDSLKLSRDFKMRYLSTMNYLLRGRLRRRREELGKAESDLFRTLGVFAKQGTRWGLAHCLIEVSELQLERGNFDEARRLVEEALQHIEALNVAELSIRGRLLELSILRAQGKVGNQELLQRVGELSRSVEGVGNSELLGMIELERGEILVHVRDLESARESFQKADEHFREIADRLPPEFRDSYLAIHHVTSKEPERTGEFREVAERSVDDLAAQVPGAGGSGVELQAEQMELLRVASLLQEFPQAGSTGLFLHKVMNCLIQATQADEGFLLLREGDKVRVLLAVDRRGDKVKKAGERICLEALEETWDGNAPILATRILDDKRVQGYETFYRENISSVAIFPLRPDPSMRGALYLNNPSAEHLTPPLGSAALASYTNLVQLTMPRPTPA